MKVFQAFRSYHHRDDPNNYTDCIAIFSNIETANMFLEEETMNKNYYRHNETYIIEVELDEVYKNIICNKRLFSKRF